MSDVRDGTITLIYGGKEHVYVPQSHLNQSAALATERLSMVQARREEIDEKDDVIDTLKQRIEEKNSSICIAQRETSLWKHRFDRQGKRVKELETDNEKVKATGDVLATVLFIAAVEFVVIVGLLFK